MRTLAKPSLILMTPSQTEGVMRALAKPSLILMTSSQRVS